MRAAVCLAELLAALMVGVQLPLPIIRFCRFSDGQGLKGVLGLFLRHLTESLLRRSVDVAPLFAPLRKYGDVREGGPFHVERSMWEVSCWFWMGRCDRACRHRPQTLRSGRTSGRASQLAISYILLASKLIVDT